MSQQNLSSFIWSVADLLRGDYKQAHETMSTQALNSEDLRDGLKDILLGPAKLYELLRGDAEGAA